MTTVDKNKLQIVEIRSDITTGSLDPKGNKDILLQRLKDAINQEGIAVVVVDPEYEGTYTNMVLETVGKNSAIAVPGSTVDATNSIIIQTTSPDPAEASQATSEIHLGSVEPSTSAKSSVFKWSHDIILLLIEVRSSMQGDFKSSKRKRRLWECVANTINENFGTNVDGDTCDIKWRNLLGTYRRIKSKLKDGDESDISWEYYAALDVLMHDKSCVAKPGNNKPSDISDESDAPAPKRSSPSPTVSETPTEQNGIKKLKRALEAPKWFVKFCEENREERRRDRQERRREIEELREERRQDRQLLHILEEKKISAFMEFNALVSQLIHK